jgi:hypothetical protein
LGMDEAESAGRREAGHIGDTYVGA